MTLPYLIECLPGFLSFIEECNIKSDDHDDLCFLTRAMRLYPELGWNDAFSQGQMRSKQWLIDVLGSYKFDLCFIMGGWVGTLGKMMCRRFDCRVRSFDIDERATRAADDVNRSDVVAGWRFKAVTADMMELDYQNTKYSVARANGSIVELEDSADLIINTSCEHIDFPSWIRKIPPGKLVALQSNDFTDGEGHVCCYPSLDAFLKAANLSEVLYSGALELDAYRRWMVIGRR